MSMPRRTRKFRPERPKQIRCAYRKRAGHLRSSALCRESVSGVDMHIGSQITYLDPFDNAFALPAELVRELRSDGHAIDHPIRWWIGILYRDNEDPDSYHP